MMEGTDVVCGCGCAEDWPEPDPGKMRLLIGSGIASTAFGGYIVARRHPKWLPIWFAGLVNWFTLCKYLICTRCERYGEACDFYYLGKWAARLFERQPDRTLDTAGIIAEGASVVILQYLPMLAAIGKPKLLIKYLALFALSQWALLSICCRKCVAYSTDPWKAKTCPSYKQAQRLFGGGEA